jgi:hypothetical protein
MTMPIVFGNNQPNDVGIVDLLIWPADAGLARTLGLPEAVMARATKPGRTLFIVP